MLLTRHRVRAFVRLQWWQRRLLLRCFCWLGLARALVLLVPFRHIAPHLGRLNGESAPAVSPAQQAVIARTRWAIARASRLTPWDSNCLAQAIAAKIVLRRDGVPSTLYVGVSKSASAFEAHAWLRSGPTIVTGGALLHRFTRLSSFGD